MHNFVRFTFMLLKKPMTSLAIGPVATIVVALLANLLAVVGLF